MLKETLNKIFPFSTLTPGEREGILTVTISILLFAIFTLAAFSILPKHCEIFSSNIEGPFACDGFDPKNPRPCAICHDKGTAIAAQFLSGLGVAFLCMPVFVYLVKNRSKDPQNFQRLLDQGVPIDKLGVEQNDEN